MAAAFDWVVKGSPKALAAEDDLCLVVRWIRWRIVLLSDRCSEFKLILLHTSPGVIHYSAAVSRSESIVPLRRPPCDPPEPREGAVGEAVVKKLKP